MSILVLERNYIPIDTETRLHACLKRKLKSRLAYIRSGMAIIS